MWNIVIACQRGPMGPDTSILACLTASDHEIYDFHDIDETLTYGKLSHMDFLGDPVAFYGSRLIISKTRKDESPNEYKDPEIFANNHLKSTYSFTWILPAIFPYTLISLVPV